MVGQRQRAESLTMRRPSTTASANHSIRHNPYISSPIMRSLKPHTTTNHCDESWLMDGKSAIAMLSRENVPSFSADQIPSWMNQGSPNNMMANQSPIPVSIHGSPVTSNGINFGSPQIPSFLQDYSSNSDMGIVTELEDLAIALGHLPDQSRRSSNVSLFNGSHTSSDTSTVNELLSADDGIFDLYFPGDSQQPFDSLQSKLPHINPSVIPETSKMNNQHLQSSELPDVFSGPIEHSIIHHQHQQQEQEQPKLNPKNLPAMIINGKSLIPKPQKPHKKKQNKKHIDPKEKVFFCQFEGCGKSFSRKKYLNAHVSCHSPDRPYRCPDCPSSFRRMPELRRHIGSVHSKVKSFKCGTCKKTFARSDALTRHLDHTIASSRCSALAAAASFSGGVSLVAE